VVGSLRVLEASIRFGVSRFVFSSSCAVYGSPQVCPVDEATPVRPLSPYGETKLAAERMLRWQARGSGMRYAALRYFNVAGAAVDSSLGEFTDGPAGQLVPRAIQAALSGGAVEIFGYDFPTADGTALRDFIHVEDLATAHVRVLEQLESPGLDGIYNLGTGQPVSVKTVLDQIEREAGRPIKRLIRPRREGDPAMSWADFGLAGRTFGWSTEYDFDDIVRSAVRWHRSRIGGVG
jgi:UDP-glucose 4-epimerase/UDP-arabinose 4-epimerase